MGFPNPAESHYDLFMTGHAGCSVSTALGLRSGDVLARRSRSSQRRGHRRRRVALGHRLRSAQQRRRHEREAARRPQRQQDVDLPPRRRRGRVPRPAAHAARTTTTSSTRSAASSTTFPSSAIRPSSSSGRSRKRSRPACTWACSSKSSDFRYIGPIDGHNIPQLLKYLRMVKDDERPVLLHVVTKKGHGFTPAVQDPVYFHTPAPFTCNDEEQVFPLKKGAAAKAYTDVASEAILAEMDSQSARHRPDGRDVPGQQTRSRPRTISRPLLRHRHLRIARRGLCRRPSQGRHAPDRRYLQHVPAAELRPDLPGGRAPEPARHVHARPRRPRPAPTARRITACSTSATCGLFPNMIVMAPGDAWDLRQMVRWSLKHDGPTSMRYPKANADEIA